MKREDLLSDDFLKQFKTGQQLNDFLGEIQKRAIEKMLEGGKPTSNYIFSNQLNKLTWGVQIR